MDRPTQNQAPPTQRQVDWSRRCYTSALVILTTLFLLYVSCIFMPRGEIDDAFVDVATVTATSAPENQPNTDARYTSDVGVPDVTAPSEPENQPNTATADTAATETGYYNEGAGVSPLSLVPPSLDEQIVHSSTIVRAALDSVRADVEEIENGAGRPVTYRPVQELRFTVYEYLKGSGTSSILVVVRGDNVYTHSALALAEANDSLSRRNAQWDSDAAMLFLNAPDPSYEPSSSALAGQDVSIFTLQQSNYGVQTPWDYSIATLSRSWLPGSSLPAQSQDDARRAATSLSLQTHFLFEPGAPVSERIVVNSLRQEIADWAAKLKNAESKPGYTECLITEVAHERARRAVPWQGITFEAGIASGSSEGSEAWSHDGNYGFPRYDRYWLDGPSAAHFRTTRIDDDGSAENGYSHVVTVSRPLVQGQYVVHEYWQLYVAVPCNFYSEDEYLKWIVTVTAPKGTAHEAFFDPVALAGGGVGADTSGNAGVLSPRHMTVDGKSSSLESLSWRSGRVTLALTDGIDLSGLALDFISLNGNTALSLKANDGTANSAKKTYTWPVADAPWAAGDLLMIRLREASTITTPGVPSATPGGPSIPGNVEG